MPRNGSVAAGEIGGFREKSVQFRAEIVQNRFRIVGFRRAIVPKRSISCDIVQGGGSRNGMPLPLTQIPMA
jgi:hypothetical protein